MEDAVDVRYRGYPYLARGQKGIRTHASSSHRLRGDFGKPAAVGSLGTRGSFGFPQDPLRRRHRQRTLSHSYFYRRGGYDRLRPLVQEPYDDFFRRRGPTGYFRDHAPCDFFGFRSQNRGEHRHNRGGGRSHGHLCGQQVRPGLPGADIGGGLLLYVPGAPHPAAGYPRPHHKEGADDTHGFARILGPQVAQDSLSHRGHHDRWICFPWWAPLCSAT